MIWVAAALAVAAVDWIAVRTNTSALEVVAKPLVMVLLIIGAITADAGSERMLIAAGLAFGLFGDVALLPRFDQFTEGLRAFLVGHLLYAAGFIAVGVSGWWVVLGAAIAFVGVGAVGYPIITEAPTKLQSPVAIYVLVIGAMLALAVGTAQPLFALGAAIFAASDVLLGRDRWVAPRTDRRFGVHMLYHVGQALLVAGLY